MGLRQDPGPCRSTGRDVFRVCRHRDARRGQAALIVVAALAACGGGGGGNKEQTTVKHEAVDERKAEKDAKGLVEELSQSVGSGRRVPRKNSQQMMAPMVTRPAETQSGEISRIRIALNRNEQPQMAPRPIISAQ